MVTREHRGTCSFKTWLMTGEHVTEGENASISKTSTAKRVVVDVVERRRRQREEALRAKAKLLIKVSHDYIALP